MSEPSWGEGYVVEIDYTHGYYRELAPATLRFATLLGGLQVADAGQPFTYYELGCGNGDSLTLHAAANPAGDFVGIDFNPTHIHAARRLAQECGVENARFLEKSFAELAALDLPDADFITLHGVYSWVSRENRRQIVDFMRRRLKPAGIAYVSYNCLPGLASVAPLQRLLREHAERGSGELPERVRRAIEFAARLSGAGAAFFQFNPVATARLDKLASQNPRYLVHEYFNANWDPYYHMDLAAELAEAKLVYAGSAEPLENFDQFVLHPKIAELLSGVNDRGFAEMIRDLARHQMFRRDVFTRGAPRAGAAELATLLGRARFTLAKPRALCQLKRKTPAGELTLEAPAYAPVLDALARAPLSFDELAQAPETAALDRARLRQAVFGMAALGNVLPALPAAGEDARRASAARYNRTVLARPAAEPSTIVLASPVLGAGVPVSFTDRLFIDGPRDRAALVEHALRAIAASGRSLMKDNRPVDDKQTARAMLDERAKWFLETLLPFLRLSGVTD